MTEMTKEEMLDCLATEAMKSLIARLGGTLSAQQLAGEAYFIAEYMVEHRQKILQKWMIAEQAVSDGIEKLNLTLRTKNCLKAEGIFTIQQLQRFSRLELLRTPNLGRKSLNEIIEQMAALGYRLRGSN